MLTSSTPRIQYPAVARWHALLHDLATPVHEISGLGKKYRQNMHNLFRPVSSKKPWSKESGPIGPGFGLLPEGLPFSFPLAAVCWNTGVPEIPNNKSQISNKSQWPKLSALRLDSPPCRVPSFKISNLSLLLNIVIWCLEFEILQGSSRPPHEGKS